jgi:hypothetical protein
MALPDYLSSFSNKQLNRVVIPGSHDAGIFQFNNSGGGKTQSLNIAAQAAAGCRWFDIRITGQVVHGKVVHSAFHSTRDPKKKDLQKNDLQYLEPKGSISTDFGGELESMLRDAKGFVEKNSTEFIIFKISKSSNIEYIYDRCRAVLGARHYVNGSKQHNLNVQKVSLLAGHVITLFSAGDCEKISKANNGDADGAFPYHELTKGKAEKNSVVYDSTNRGLQYFGKYTGTIYTGKNSDEQIKKFKGYLKSDGYDVDAMGVLYWTLTTSWNPQSLTVSKNIEKRNVKQWNKSGVDKLRRTFGNIIYSSIEQKMGKRTYYPNNNDFPLYMPNVVMMDFVDDMNCREVFLLNFTTNGVIQGLINEAQSETDSTSHHNK